MSVRRELLERRLRGKGARPRAADEIAPAPRDGPLQLSYGQERMWFLDQLQPGSAEYLLPLALRVRGALDEAALRFALDQVVARHEVLRTRYLKSGQGPVQVIDPPDPVALEAVDLRALGPQEREARLAELLASEERRPFDLAAGPVLRARWVRLSADEEVVALVAHHIASDGWSMEVLARELDALYRAFREGRAAPLPPLPLQYADYALWQRGRLSGEVLEQQVGYWRKTLAGLQPLELPLDRPRPPVRSPAGSTVTFAVKKEVASALVELGRSRGATPFMVLLAAFQALLHRYSGQDDVVVGTPVAGRTRPEVESLVGFFINMLVLRSDLSGDPPFLQLLERVKEICLDAYAHQELPFEKLVDALQPERDLSRNPLFQVLFGYDTTQSGRRELGGFEAEELGVGWELSKFDLSLHMAERPDGTMAGVLEYASALFDRATVERMAGHLLALLEHAARAPQTRLSRLELMGPAERRQVLEVWNGAAMPVPERCVHQLVEQQARATPDAVAVAAGAERLTYAQLDARANQLAHHLRALGVGLESPVGLCLHRGAGMVASILGILKAGGAYVPLDPEYPQERLDFMLADTGVQVAVAQEATAARVAAGGRRVVVLERDREALGRCPREAPPPLATPDSLAYVIFTSGSTGRPKGAMNAHRAVCNRLWWMQGEYGLRADDAVLQKTPFSFDVSVWEFFWPLMTGARLVMAEPGGHRDPAYLLRVIDQERITTLHFVPSMLRAFLDEPGVERCASIRRVVCSGEALPPELKDRCLEKLPRAELHNLYGPTEAAVDVTAHACRARDGRATVPIGRPVANTQIRILDARLEPVPIGVPGELYIGGVQVGRGYRARPELTAERFIPDPFGGARGARLYRTGDVARWLEDGGIEYLGRVDFQVKLRGFRIELGEIESALLGHPRVAAAAVVLQKAGGGDASLVAYVVPRERGALTPGLREYLGERLPSHMVPSLVLALEALPLTSSGKVDRKALPRPDGVRPEPEHGAVGPRTPLEERVATVWADVLGLDRVGVHDNFFNLGGDSIRAVRLVGALKSGGMSLSVQDLFRQPTIAGLCASGAVGRSGAVDEPRAAPFELLSPGDRASLPPGVEDAYPLSQVQAGMLYQMLADAQLHLYQNVTCYLMRDDGPFSLPALRESARRLARRHELLRTSFDLTSGSEPLQLVHGEAEAEVGYGDLRGLDEAARRSARDAQVATLRAARLDLARPPLLRFHVHQVAHDAWWLYLVECHAIQDGWSLHGLLAELMDGYRALRAGRAPGDPSPLPTRYADFVAAERQVVASGEDRDFWKGRIESHGRLALPEAWADRDGPNDFYDVRVPLADLEPALRRLARESGVSLKSVLLAVHLKALGTAGGQRRFFTGLVCNGRLEREGSDRVVGMFLNSVPFAVDLDAPTWRRLVQAVFAEEIELWPHRRYPLPAMQRQWGGGKPLLGAIFNYLDFGAHDVGGVDLDESVDVAPNEFALHVTTDPGGLMITAWSRAVGRRSGELLGQLYREVAAAMAADPDGDPRRTFLPGPERHRLLVAWNDSAAEVPDGSLTGWFEARARATPEATAVVSGAERVSYAALNARANRLARLLRGSGVGPDSVVGVCVDRDPDLWVALLGVLKAGGAYLPLDPDHPPERLAYMLSDAGARWLISQRRHAGRVPAGQAHVVWLDEARERLEAQPGDDLPPAGDAANLAYVIYTSGSTGRPKGVMVTRGALANLAWSMCRRPGFTPADTLVAVTTVSFDIAAVELYVPLLVGARVVMAGREQVRDAQALAALAAEHGASKLQATPALWRMLLDGGWRPREGFAILCGGEKLPADLARRLTATGAEVWDLYGPTETTVWSSAARLGGGGRVAQWAPVANNTLHVLDGALDLVPTGVVGELYIGGGGLARGYRGRPDLTAERFLPDPYAAAPGARMYRTGDLARRGPDGQVEILGRSDHQVKLRGFRIELEEIEARLLEHPAVRASVVVAREVQPGDPRLVAYVVPRAEAPEGRALAAFLKERLPEYMVPSLWVALEALPLTPGGKVDRQALPSPEGAGPAPGREYAAPRTPLEAQLAALWAEVLGLERAGIHDGFFDLGGHSLLVMKAVKKAKEAHGLDLTFRHVVEHRTPAAVAQALSAAQGDAGSLIWFRREGGRPPLFCVHPGGGSGHWFLELSEAMGPGQPVAAFEWPGLTRDGVAAQSIEHMAASYLADLRRVRPRGPYWLLGWCGGSGVTLELARALRAAGEPVELFLLDPVIDLHASEVFHDTLQRFRVLQALLRSVLAAPDPSEAAAQADEALDLLRRVVEDGGHPTTREELSEAWLRRVKVWGELLQARMEYRFRPQPGGLHLLLGDELAEGQHEVIAGLTYQVYLDRWRHLAPSGVRVHRVPGTHFSVLKPPHVVEVARVVREQVDDEQAKAVR